MGLEKGSTRQWQAELVYKAFDVRTGYWDLEQIDTHEFTHVY